MQSMQIVVVDVDGTVTQSDVLGHVLPRLGYQHAHDGICSLLHQIQRMGYLHRLLVTSWLAFSNRARWDMLGAHGEIGCHVRYVP